MVLSSVGAGIYRTTGCFTDIDIDSRADYYVEPTRPPLNSSLIKFGLRRKSARMLMRLKSVASGISLLSGQKKLTSKNTFCHLWWRLRKQIIIVL
jgi:hypothetical protein